MPRLPQGCRPIAAPRPETASLATKSANGSDPGAQQSVVPPLRW
jgi:hypothetical protein